MSPAERKPHILPLTSLRFFAAICVVFYHGYTDPRADWPAWLISCFSTGYMGVSLFFILSGFILTYTYASETGGLSLQLRSFAVARFARLYPVYLVGFLLSFPSVVVSWYLEENPLRSIFYISVIGSANLSLLQAWVPKLALVCNAPGWSLSAEAFFYCMFPLVAAPLVRSSLRRIALVLVFCWLASQAAPIVAVLTDAPEFWQMVVKHNPLMRLPEFLFGIALGRIFLLNRSTPVSPNPIRWHLGAWALGAILVVTLSLSKQFPYLCLHNGLLAPLFGLLIYGLATEEGLLQRVLSVRPLVRLGEASYAVYILHMPIFSLLLRILHWLGFAPSHSVGFFLAYTVITVLVSLLAFKWVEEPARKWVRQKLMRQSDARSESDSPRIAVSTLLVTLDAGHDDAPSRRGTLVGPVLKA